MAFVDKNIYGSATPQGLSSQADRVAELLRSAASSQQPTMEDKTDAYNASMGDVYRSVMNPNISPSKTYQDTLKSSVNMRTSGVANQLEMEGGVYDLMQKQIQAGNQQAKAVYDTIAAYTPDPAEQSNIMEELHKDPEEVTPQNMYLKVPAAVSRLGIQRRAKKEDYLPTGDGRFMDINTQQIIGKEKAPSGFQYGADGNMQPIPGGPQDPKVMTSTATPTASNLGAAGYANRMAKAEELIQSFEQAGYNPSDDIGSYTASGIPVAGNYMKSKEYQQYEQAASDWIAAKLRKESGATIPQPELESEFKRYFPIPGDGPEVIKQKAAARANGFRQLQVESGSAYKTNFNDFSPYGAEGGQKVRVSNGSETFEIDPADLPEAEAEGFKVMQ